MAKDVNPPRGMRDFLPVEKAKRERVLSAIRGTYAKHGYQEIETPALEDLGRLTSGQGGDNEKLAYRVMKRGEELERALGSSDTDALADLGLRFDLTVPLTRYYATNHAKLPRVFKAIQTGPVWRAERPQKGRYRQFIQCDIDIIGDASELAEVDLLVSSLDALKAVGITDATIRVNHRALLTSLLEGLGVPADGYGKAMIIVDKLDKIFAEGVTAELSEAFGHSVGAAFAGWVSTLQADSVPASLSSLFDAVAVRHPGKLVFDPTLVRGMGYYTGTIFEISHPASGSSIGGGGRYDGMVGKWTGNDVPAVGISLGFERVVDLVAMDAASGGVVLVLEDGSASVVANALRVQEDLMALGHSVRLEQRSKKLNLLLESMVEQGFTQWASVDAATDSVTLKPLA
ncbi:MAG: histidine--tRNA ligase [Micrococcales bacterium]